MAASETSSMDAQARNMALYHTLAAGKSHFGKAVVWVQLTMEFTATWFLVFAMMIFEQIAFRGWMDRAVHIKD